MIKDKRAHLIVLGSQWGDEGKAKIIDILAANFDIIGRYQGGGNAGHTIVIKGNKIVFHMVPTGVIHPGKFALLGNGMVIHPPALAQELQELRQRGINFDDRLIISSRAHAIMPYHQQLEKYAEEKRGLGRIGTTLRGIGPAYEDKAARCGILMADLVDERRFAEKVKTNLVIKNSIIQNVYHGEPLTCASIIDEYRPSIELFKRFIQDGAFWLNDSLDRGLTLLCEGAQGTHLDIDHGTYPFVTSSNSSAGGALTGLGIGPNRFRHVLGVAKAYVTRVGEGPFPTEDLGDEGNRLRECGHEYGATTGRSRRCGWFDVPAMLYAARINGLTALALTKLDVLTGFDRIRICTGYSIENRSIGHFPEDPELLKRCSPLYLEVPGWDEPLGDVKTWEQLPGNAQAYIMTLQKLTGVEIVVISTGPEREQSFFVKDTRFGADFPGLVIAQTV